MNNKPITFEDKMKYRDNEFLYDKCIKQHDCIMNSQWKMREYKDIINKVIEICKNYEKYKEQWFEEECKNALDDIHTVVRGEKDGKNNG